MQHDAPHACLRAAEMYRKKDAAPVATSIPSMNSIPETTAVVAVVVSIPLETDRTLAAYCCMYMYMKCSPLCVSVDKLCLCW
jgi:hypothetical protein